MFYVFQGAQPLNTLKNPSEQFEPKWCDAWEVDRINGDAERCPECGRFISALEWLPPRKIRLTSTRYPDTLREWLGEPLVVSGRFVDAFRAAGLTGIREFVKIDEVRAPRKTSPTPPDYYCAKVDFSNDVKVDYQKSLIHGRKYEWSCDLCNPLGSTADRIDRLVLDTTSWRGEDVLNIYGHGLVFSQRFYEFVQQNGFTNFNLVPVEQYRGG